MNYEKHYNTLIESAKNRPQLTGYYETHHIIPRCMGGSNDKDNLVDLTAREHYIAHMLLYYEYKTSKLAYAWSAMSMNKKERRLTNRQYEKIKVLLSEAQKGVKLSEETRRKVAEAQKGRKHSEETRRKRSSSLRGRKHSEETLRRMSKAKKNISEETRRKMSEAKKGKKLSEEHRRKMSEAQKGRKHSEETRKNISNALKGKKISQATKLGLQKWREAQKLRWQKVHGELV